MTGTNGLEERCITRRLLNSKQGGGERDRQREGEREGEGERGGERDRQRERERQRGERKGEGGPGSLAEPCVPLCELDDTSRCETPPYNDDKTQTVAREKRKIQSDNRELHRALRTYTVKCMNKGHLLYSEASLMGSVLYSEVPLRMFYCVQNIIGPSTTSRPHFSNEFYSTCMPITCLMRLRLLHLSLSLLFIFSVLTPHPPLSRGHWTLLAVGSSGRSPMPHPRAGHRTPPICSTNSSVPNLW